VRIAGAAVAGKIRTKVLNVTGMIIKLKIQEEVSRNDGGERSTVDQRVISTPEVNRYQEFYILVCDYDFL
jgi:hypothetical protein